MTYRQDQITKAYESYRPPAPYFDFVDSLSDVQKIALLTDTLLRVAGSKGFASYLEDSRFSVANVEYLVKKLSWTGYDSMLQLRLILEKLLKVDRGSKYRESNVMLLNDLDARLSKHKEQMELELDKIFSFHESNPQGHAMFNDPAKREEVSKVTQGTTRFRSEVD